MTLASGSLFSGYGGLDLAVEDVLRTRTVWTCDVDQAASRILRHRFPHAPNLGDIGDIDWSTVRPVHVLTGGFPCQDVSPAGARLGLGPGTRSGLWSRMADAIDNLRPPLVIVENVRGLLSAAADSDVEPCPWCLGDGTGQPPLRALGAVLADLADLGYDASWYGLRAADVGAAHSRFRVFVLAWPSGRTPADSDGIGRERGGTAAFTGSAGPRKTGQPARSSGAPADTHGIGPGSGRGTTGLAGWIYGRRWTEGCLGSLRVRHSPMGAPPRPTRPGPDGARQQGAATPLPGVR